MYRLLLFLVVAFIACSPTIERAPSQPSSDLVSDEYVKAQQYEVFTLLEVVVRESHICQPVDRMDYYSQTLKYLRQLEDLEATVLDESVSNVDKVRRLREANKTLHDWSWYMEEVGCYEN